MQKRDIILIHKSAIVQKGLNSIIYIHQKTSVKSVQNYKDLEILKSARKSFIFVDAALDSVLMVNRAKILNNGNVVVGIAVKAKQTDYMFPFKEIIYVDDSESRLNVKLDRIFPADAAEGDRSIITKREKDVLECVAKGLSSQEIADKLFISRHTVITHRKNICGKLGIKTVSGLTLYALVNKII